MFEMLSKQILKRKVAETITELHSDKEVVSADIQRQNMIESFIMKNSYKDKNLVQYSLKLLSLLAKAKEISQGAFFISDTKDGKPVIKFLTGFATPDPDNTTDIFELGEGFPGQAAKDGNLINLSDIPQGYLSIESGLGKSSPVSLLILPVKSGNKVLAVIELASFHKFTADDELFFEGISPSIAEQIQKCIKK
jgi:GAF domain-containing protein